MQQSSAGITHPLIIIISAPTGLPPAANLASLYQSPSTCYFWPLRWHNSEAHSLPILEGHIQSIAPWTTNRGRGFLKASLPSPSELRGNYLTSLIPLPSIMRIINVLLQLLGRGLMPRMQECQVMKQREWKFGLKTGVLTMPFQSLHGGNIRVTAC